MADDMSPGGQISNPHADQRNFTISDYLDMCRRGEATFSVAEAARIMGVTRQWIYRAMDMASIPDEMFEDILANHDNLSTTGVIREARRRLGLLKESPERCPHCGEVIRVRRR